MDDYKITNYPENFFDYFIDLGACVGDVSVMFAKNNPRGFIVAYEPCKENYEKLVDNTKGMRIVTVNEALGKGNHLYFSRKDRADQHIFLETDTGDYCVQSRSLSEIFSIHNIDIQKKCCLKIDCEGGESYLIGDKDSEEIMKKCDHVALEVHFAHKGDRHMWLNVFPTWEVYNRWVYDIFQNTHNIIYWRSSSRDGHGVYVIEKK